MADKHPLNASIPFESVVEHYHHKYLTLFSDHSEREDILLTYFCLESENKEGGAVVV